MIRKLATIQEIVDIQPIANADAIERVQVRGWWCVAKKGEFQKGDKVVYFEVDSFLPIIPQFSFLEPRGRKILLYNGEDVEGYQLKTVKLRGQISQGLCLPLEQFSIPASTPIGSDVTEDIGVLKFEKPIPANLVGIAKGRFPSFIEKTEEERIQNLPEYIETMQGRMFYITEKVDGSSATYYLRDSEFGVCSRNIDLLETDDNFFWILAREQKIEQILRDYQKNIAIQGELLGPKIQSNRLRLSHLTLMVFNIFDIDTQSRYNFLQLKEFCQRYELKMVPIIEEEWSFQGSMRDIIAMADGQSMVHPVKREGIVFRALDNVNISFKSISNSYLLKNEK